MKYEIKARVEIEVRTIIEADSEIEAEQEARDREVSICIHGTEDSYAENDWVYADAPNLDYKIDNIEEYEDDE
jgi:hypothetical protein